MPIEFKLEERLAGFLATSARKGEHASVVFREMLGPDAADLGSRLDGMHQCLFSKVPGLPNPTTICDLVVIVDRDLNARAYVDELSMAMRAVATRAIGVGEPVHTKDISSVESVDLGIPVSENEAIVVVRSFYWKRSLFYDFGPIHDEAGPRRYCVGRALGQQLTLLLGLPAPAAGMSEGGSRLQIMKESLDRLRDLLESECREESAYQELISGAPWMLGTNYSALLRHQKMDDENIPDFTLLRAYDECQDIAELKQPFLRLFRSDGSFSANFGDAWNQAERYLDFCSRQRVYLSDQKGLRFENPRCILLVGFELSAEERNAIRAKESMNRLITVMTYDELLRNAWHVFDMVAAAEDRNYPAD